VASFTRHSGSGSASSPPGERVATVKQWATITLIQPHRQPPLSQRGHTPHGQELPAASVRFLGVALDVHAEMVACVWCGQLEAALTDAKALLTCHNHMTSVADSKDVTAYALLWHRALGLLVPLRCKAPCSTAGRRLVHAPAAALLAMPDLLVHCVW